MQNKIFMTRSNRAGYTLIEIMVVASILIVIFASLSTILLNSQRGWERGRDKLVEAQQARLVADRLVGLLRESNPDWNVGGTHYPVTISVANTRIDFYTPVFNSSGNVTSLRKVTFKIDPNNSTQILMKVGTEPERISASAVDTFNISCACTGCTAVDQNCPRATVNVVTRKSIGFNLTSQVTLRNTNMAVSQNTTIEEPLAGEF